MMGLYYPAEVTLEMGPTCISPGSQYFEVDRLEWGTLGTGIDPPVSESEPHAAEWHEAVARDGRVMNGCDPAARDQVLDRTGAFWGREQKKLVVPAGAVVLIHFDILHRGSRQFFEKLGDPESPLPDGLEQPNRALKYRTMYKLQFFRTSAPTPAHDTAAEAAAEEAEAAAAFASSGASAGQQAIWRSTYRWLRGLDGVGEVEESVEALAVQLSEGETEPERVVSPLTTPPPA